MLVEYLVPYFTSNIIAALILLLAFRAPRLARGLVVALFVWASITNTRIALTNPIVYLDYGNLTLSTWYRDFIDGWFSQHIQPFVLAIAVGQLAVAWLLTRPRWWRRAGIAGAVVFLLAIAPLGVGSALPFSLTLSAALVFMHRRLGDGVRPTRAATPALP